MKQRFKSKFLGAMIGSALGDAVGELAFRNRDRDRLVGVVNQSRELCYTDDTAMSLGMAESLLARKGLDPEHLGETFRRNFYQEPWRGYASGPPTIFHLVQTQKVTYGEAARSLFAGMGSLGNGAAMRIAPLGLAFHKAADLYELAAASAEVTHAHPVGKDGAAVQALAVATAFELDPLHAFPAERFIDQLTTFSRTREMRDKLKFVKQLTLTNATSEQSAVRLGQSVAVDESLPFALYAFLRNTKSFEEVLFCAVLNGGDRDTLGAMACAVSGAYLGIEAVPGSWIERLENLTLIRSLAEKLFDRFGGG
jgi:poly(ADP-ribose) glycohydrolase ARH3